MRLTSDIYRVFFQETLVKKTKIRPCFWTGEAGIIYILHKVFQVNKQRRLESE